MKKVYIIIPAYNEEKRIGRTLEEYGKFLDKKEFDFKIVVVLNGCIDNTLDIVREYMKKDKKIEFIDMKEKGKGLAIIRGFKFAIENKADLIGFVDADLATPPKAFYSLVKNINGYDGIIANRWLKGSKVKRDFLRKIISKGFNFWVRSLLFLPYKDTQCGAKLFRKKVIEDVIDRIESIRWAFDPNLLYLMRKKGYRIKEHPTIWQEKGKSKISVIGSSIQMFSAIARLRLIHSPFNFIVKAYGKIPEKIKFHHRF